MDNDTFLANLLQKTPRKAEALAWIKQDDGVERFIGDLDPQKAQRFVSNLYKNGALEVIAIDINTYNYTGNNAEETNTLIVSLPQESAAHEALFKVEATTARKGGFDSVGDDDQKYFMLHW